MRNLHHLKKNASSASNHVELIISGKEYFKKLEELIDKADYYIHFQTYVFQDDITGTHIQKALIRAAKRGVKIYLLLDAFGSSALPKKFIHEMTSAGIEFRFYGQLFSRWAVHVSRRMHHKIFVVDGVYSVVGGINISDNYNDTPGSPAWLDFAVLSKGPISLELLLICLRKWKRRRLRKIPPEYLNKKNEHENHTQGCFVYARENDPLLNKNQVSSTYRKAFKSAEKEIIIAGGYFIPGFVFRQLMKRAVRRGVEIKIITGSKSDVGVAKNAKQFLYNWMLKNNIEVYEYQVSNVHAKVATVDKEWATVGSYDLNNLSAYSNIELNVDIMNEAFAAHLHNVLEKIIKEDCIQITSDSLMEGYNWEKQFRAWLSYRIVRGLFWVSEVLIFKHKRKKE
jgi:cardiolipin synthase A/B